MKRKASAVWRGGLKDGKGTISSESGVLKETQYSFSTRFENGLGTNPEELIGAAHAACFSMALSAALERAGTPVESVQTNATVTLRLVDGTPTITKIELVTRGRVPGIDEATFVKEAEGAKVNCPVSRALASVPEITLEASLA
jgi:osmotically inducible protein OsmC